MACRPIERVIEDWATQVQPGVARNDGAEERGATCARPTRDLSLVFGTAIEVELALHRETAELFAVEP